MKCKYCGWEIVNIVDPVSGSEWVIPSDLRLTDEYLNDDVFS